MYNMRDLIKEAKECKEAKKGAVQIYCDGDNCKRITGHCGYILKEDEGWFTCNECHGQVYKKRL